MKSWSTLIRATLLALTVVAGTGEAATKCAMELIDEWPVRLQGNRVVLDGTADGQPIAILLGTGAQQSVMMRAAAERLNLNRAWVRGFPLFGLAGESRAEAVNVSDLRFGRFAFQGWRLQIPIDQRLGDDVDVVLGEDFFSTMDVEFDLAHRAVRLFKPNGVCDGVSLAYWAAGGASEVAIERVFCARPQIILPVRVNGQAVKALLDTGATVSLLALRDAREAGLSPGTPGVVAAGNFVGIGEAPVDVWAGPLKSFAVADEMLGNVTIRFADIYRNVKFSLTGSRVPYRAGPEQPMLLGVDFLRAYRVLVAHSQQKIYLTRVAGEPFGSGDSVPAASAWVGGARLGL